jgi:hypothetical protein
MPIPLALIAGGAQLISGLIKGGQAKKQRREGNNILNEIGPEVVPQDVLDNQVMAKQMANQGLPSQQYANAMKNIQRQQLMAMRGATDRRGGLAAISATQQAANDALGNLDEADARQHMANQGQLMAINNQVGNWKNKIWERKYNYGMDLVGSGNQNKVSAFDSIASGIGNAAYGAFGEGGIGKIRFGRRSGGGSSYPGLSAYDRVAAGVNGEDLSLYE